MFTAQLSLNGQTFPLPHKVLLEVAGIIAGRASAQPELFEALLALDIPSVTQALADGMNMFYLSRETADRIWQQGDRKTRTRLLYDEEFLHNLSCEQVDDILNVNDEEQLAIVAEHFNARFAGRLDSAQIDALCARLVSMPNRTIRKALADNDHLPDGAWDIGLEERIAQNALRFDDYRRLSPQDVELFHTADDATLGALSRFMDVIRDDEALRAVIKLFLEHEDPVWRQELTDNICLSEKNLNMLSESDDPLIVAFAKEKLQDRSASH